MHKKAGIVTSPSMVTLMLVTMSKARRKFTIRSLLAHKAIKKLVPVLIILEVLGLEKYIVAGSGVLAALFFGYFAFRFMLRPPEMASAKDRIVMSMITSFAAMLLLLLSLQMIGVLPWFVLFMFVLVGGFSVALSIPFVDWLLTRLQTPHPPKIKFEPPSSPSGFLFPIFFGAMTAFWIVLARVPVIATDPEFQIAFGVIMPALFFAVFLFSIANFFFTIEK